MFAPNYNCHIGHCAKFIYIPITILFWLLLPSGIHGQRPADQLMKDGDGILRWRENEKEVSGFGVNYTVPFAHAYRSAIKLGIDPKAAIDQDIFQFSRLGLDLYRVHVWDCEISDSLGNLLENEHLDMFDYLLSQLAAHNINAIITPIAFWGNGWPEPDEKTPGFSTKYGKDNCLTDPDAIKAQENYLSQFVRHKNKYTGIAYLHDPSILAFEISNEPHHREDPFQVKMYIEKMMDAIQNTGCTKPIFYNVSHSVQLAHTYYESGIDGGTFQWYPTGLGFQKELGGNMLPNVDAYSIPFDDVMRDAASARIVYEFDAADMASTYMYPAMARSFRSAGIQLATHFSYDPTFLAPYNTEYNTHFMNLIYAPRKAISLMICAEVFRQIPLYSTYGTYPDNSTFGPFRVDYENDLAELVTDDKFYYTNHTTTIPAAIENIKHIAGWGNSPVIRYGGTGAYFLDKIIPGMWLLEVYPDAVVTENLFGRNSLEKQRAAVIHNERNMEIRLPELADGVFVGNIKSGETIEAADGKLSIRPGVYLLSTPDVLLDNKGFIKAYEYLDSLKPDRFYTHIVKTNLKESVVLPHTASEATAGQALDITCEVITVTKPDSVLLWYYKDWELVSQPMQWLHGFSFSGHIPQRHVSEGNLSYYITVHSEGVSTTYPSRKKAKPGDWDFDATQSYQVVVSESTSPMYLFDASTDIQRLNRNWLPGSKKVGGDRRGQSFLYLKTERLQHTDPENVNGYWPADYSMRHYFGDFLAGRKDELTSKKTMTLEAHTPEKVDCPLQVALIMKDGSAFGSIVHVKSNKNTYEISLQDLKKVDAVILPRPYPTFLPYYAVAGNATELDMSQIESLQISIGPGLKSNEVNDPHEIYIGSVWLE